MEVNDKWIDFMDVASELNRFAIAVCVHQRVLVAKRPKRVVTDRHTKISPPFRSPTGFQCEIETLGVEGHSDSRHKHKS
jgi:hypothetical protein